MAETRVVSVVVDRIEGEIAVLEVGGATVDWPRAALPAGIAEGSRMSFAISGVSPDADLEAEAKARLERLRARGPQSDDIDL